MRLHEILDKNLDFNVSIGKDNIGHVTLANIAKVKELIKQSLMELMPDRRACIEEFCDTNN